MHTTIRGRLPRRAGEFLRRCEGRLVRVTCRRGLECVPVVAWAFVLVVVGLLVVGCTASRTTPFTPHADVELFAREGCPRCDEAKQWLVGLRSRSPGTTIAVTDVGTDAGARACWARPNAPEGRP